MKTKQKQTGIVSLVEMIKSAAKSFASGFTAATKGNRAAAMAIAEAEREGKDGIALIVEVLVADHGFEKRAAGNALRANAVPFVGAVNALHAGILTEAEFNSVSTQEARRAFKECGGAKGAGRDAAAWVQALRNPKTREETTSQADPAGAGVSPAEKMLAALQAQWGLASEEERDTVRKWVAAH